MAGMARRDRRDAEPIENVELGAVMGTGLTAIAVLTVITRWRDGDVAAAAGWSLCAAACATGAFVQARRVWRIRREQRRARAGRCTACGYDLTGNVSAVCPECGTPAARQR